MEGREIGTRGVIEGGRNGGEGDGERVRGSEFMRVNGVDNEKGLG